MYDLIPLSILSLDLPAPVDIWNSTLAGHGISIRIDDLGRPCIRRADARVLFTERRDAEARARDAAERHDRELERQRLAQLRGGVPADLVPAGLTPAEAMMAAERDTAPRRRSVLDEALANRDEIVYHPIVDEEDY